MKFTNIFHFIFDPDFQENQTFRKQTILFWYVWLKIEWMWCVAVQRPLWAIHGNPLRFSFSLYEIWKLYDEYKWLFLSFLFHQHVSVPDLLGGKTIIFHQKLKNRASRNNQSFNLKFQREINNFIICNVDAKSSLMFENIIIGFHGKNTKTGRKLSNNYISHISYFITFTLFSFRELKLYLSNKKTKTKHWTRINLPVFVPLCLEIFKIF